jgi:hypothetical protein
VIIPGNVTGERKTGGGLPAFMGNLTPVLSLFFIGFPVGRATIRTMLIGWILIVVAITQLVLRHYFQTAGSASAMRTVPVSSKEYEHYR